jgi:hypothetical protein
MSWRADQERAGGSRTSSGAIVSFGLAAIALGLLLGTGPISLFPAVLAILVGAWTRYKLSVSTPERGGKGTATAAVILGLIVGAFSVVMMAGTQAT